MKKSLPALLLALCLLVPVPVRAAQEGVPARQRTYAGEFSDLTADSPFYNNVAALYEYGLAGGKDDGTFGLGDAVTLGQAVIFAGRIRGLCSSGDPEAALAYRHETTPAALAYLRYLQAETGLELEMESYTEFYRPATRAQVAHVLVNTLPDLPDVNGELVTQGYASRRYITDVTEYTPYYQDILALYRKGVAAGSDASGSFLPNEPITRGAVAAMLTRMVDPALRVRPQWDLTGLSSAEGATLADLVEPGKYILSPSNHEELDSSIRYMLASGENRILLYYDNLSNQEVQRLIGEMLDIVKSYCEQGYNEVHCVRGAGLLTISFTAVGAGDQVEALRTAAMEAAVKVHDQLWAQGTLRPDMSELEKARVYYQWVCENCAYDYEAGDDSLSHTPYSLLVNRLAVCDGYTGAYNLFLKLEGIDCSAFFMGNHIWTVATLDGVEYHIDTTWGDTGGETDFRFFAMTPQQSQALHAQRAA